MATQTGHDDVQKQVDALRKDFSELAATLKDVTANYAHQSQEKLKDKAEYLQDQAKASARRAQAEVEAHPYTSMAFAFGIGLIIGKILDR
jgi:ElaB/YqjD/DUF883 family membrane-anchored ribosome-binding protein